MAVPQLNVVTVSGRLTREPETRDFGDNSVTKVGIALNESFRKDGEWKTRVCFIDVEAWNKTGEKLDGLTKGDGVIVTGKLRQDEWEGDDGKTRRSTFIAADRVYTLEVLPSEEGAKKAPAEEDDIPY